MIDALRELANALDDHGEPSMTVDNIRLEMIGLKVAAMQRRARANDNQQSTRETA